jgi:hypothetical protein
MSDRKFEVLWDPEIGEERGEHTFQQHRPQPVYLSCQVWTWRSQLATVGNEHVGF